VASLFNRALAEFGNNFESKKKLRTRLQIRAIKRRSRNQSRTFRERWKFIARIHSRGVQARREILDAGLQSSPSVKQLINRRCRWFIALEGTTLAKQDDKPRGMRDRYSSSKSSASYARNERSSPNEGLTMIRDVSRVSTPDSRVFGTD